MPNVKWTKAELVIWNIFLIALGAGLTGGATAILQYWATTNVDIVLCVKLAGAGAIGAFLGSISTSFRKNGNATQNLLQAALDLLSQVHDAVTTQVVQTAPQSPARQPEPIILTPQPAQGTAIQAYPQILPSVDNMTAQSVSIPMLNPLASTATATVPAPPAWHTEWQTDLHFGDTGLIPIIPKQ